ncbi:unnamed protein product [Nezara viridula]|uniref:Uncharacterized protein n=1 Tax=Nezara viridula TaxID=85310 RepID=A0A9P0E408_NEZVI|nr:unnamed protein product [Nezara viridula]
MQPSIKFAEWPEPEEDETGEIDGALLSIDLGLTMKKGAPHDSSGKWRSTISLVLPSSHIPVLIVRGSESLSFIVPAFLRAFRHFWKMQWWKRRRITKVIGSSHYPLVLKSYSLCSGSQRGGAEEEEEDDMNTSAPVISRTTFNEGEYLHYCYNLREQTWTLAKTALII